MVNAQRIRWAATIALAGVVLVGCATPSHIQAAPPGPLAVPAQPEEELVLGTDIKFRVEPITDKRLAADNPVNFGMPLLKALDDSLLLQLYGSSSCPPIISDASLSSALQLSVTVDDDYYIRNPRRCTRDLAPHTFHLYPYHSTGTADPAEDWAELMQVIERSENPIWSTSKVDANGVFLQGSQQYPVIADRVLTSDSESQNGIIQSLP